MKRENKRILGSKKIKNQQDSAKIKKEAPPKKMSPFTNINYKIIFPSYIR